MRPEFSDRRGFHPIVAEDFIKAKYPHDQGGLRLDGELRWSIKIRIGINRLTDQ